MEQEKELVMFGRSWACPDQMRTQRFLTKMGVPYRMVMIDQDEAAGALVEQYVGHRSVPTMVVARPNENAPVVEPTQLTPGRSARSVDRGTLITEPSDEAMRAFLQRHELLTV